MIKLLLPIIFAVAAAKQSNDSVSSQLIDFKTENEGSVGVLTTGNGAPVEYTLATTTLNKELLSNQYFTEDLGHFDREIIPERVAHAQGTGAFGYFEVTDDITDICCSALFSEVGKQTPVAVRFSTTTSSRGASEFAREARGFAVKFYTEEGNYDFVGLDSEMFSVKDPLLTATVVHIAKRNPVNNLPDFNMAWDFITLHPENFFRIFYSLSDYGMPDGYRHVSGHGIHTFEVYNSNGTKSMVRIHMMPDAGRLTLNNSQIATLSSADPNYFTRDLYNAIADENYPSWTMQMQVLTQDDVDNADFDVYDITRVLPKDKYPYISVGKLVLNQNPTNYFSQIEQMAVCPGNLVPGMLGAPDKLFAGRSFAYRDTQFYRLGANFDRIPVNCPIGSKIYNYNRDGAPPVGDNGGSAPWYYPNSFNGPEPYVDNNRPALSVITESQPDNFDQASDFYLNELTDAQRETLYENLIVRLCGAENFLQDKVVYYLTILNSDLGERVNTYVTANCRAY